jgi:SAM-dependent methyltransferase
VNLFKGPGMSSEPVEQLLFPEMSAGGYPRSDHRMAFLVRVNCLLTPGMTVLDFGAGRGKWQHDPVPFRRWLGDFRGRCRRVIGADVGPAIQDNPQVDERVTLVPGKPVPLPDSSVDLILAFSVLEHIDDPEFWASELSRILRPGGWICGWTPNRWGYVGVGASLIPRGLHRHVLQWLEPRRQEEDSFPPAYRMNTLGTLKRLFPSERFLHCSYTYDGRPYYHCDRVFIARLWLALYWATPTPLKGYLMVVLRKHGTPADTSEPWPVAAPAAA